MNDKYEITIGIECHVQLCTKTKLFSNSNNDARGLEPNQAVNQIDFGLPGVLPVLNKEAVRMAVLAGKALNSKIANVSRFDRKHYFYPDLPKGYQTTQMYHPIILGGYVDAPMENGTTVRVTLDHAHLEEDAGKLNHYLDYSLVDLNRAGTPLIEIVSNPDMHDPAEAKAYTEELHRLMLYAGVTLGDLYKGNMRFDVNTSVALKGASELGTRTEVKNLNSFRSVERASEYEAKRQIALLEKGGTIKQETRGWNEAKQKTVSQRSKENAKDYRYMPDADIPPIVLTDEYIENVQSHLPQLPQYYREKWSKLNLDRSVVASLLDNQDFAKLISQVEDEAGADHAVRVAHWLSSDIISDDADDAFISTFDLQPSRFIELSKMVAASELSSTSAKEVFNVILKEDKSPRQIAKERNLLQVSDDNAMQKIVDQVLSDPACQQSIEDIKNGKDKAIGFLVGQVMKASRGKANPAMAQKMIRESIK